MIALLWLAARSSTAWAQSGTPTPDGPNYTVGLASMNALQIARTITFGDVYVITTTIILLILVAVWFLYDLVERWILR